MNDVIESSILQSVGLRWQPSGQSVLSGELLQLATRVDQSLVAIARSWAAGEYQFPTFVSAAELQKLDYFRSFPHLVTFPLSLDQDEANVEAFMRGKVVDDRGAVELTRAAPIREVLTPAACYHVYVHEQGRAQSHARYYTTKNTCFRRERYYEALRRQWAFSMREIVCAGTLGEVTSFLAACRRQVEELLAVVGLPVEWTAATDPFFQPSKNAKYLAQRVNPTKTEAVFGGDLAIASINLHQDHFGRAFEIQRDGAPAYTGCVAFGIERWLYAVLAVHGLDARHWPAFPVAERRAPRAELAVAAGGR